MTFDPQDFLPYLLNRAAEQSSASFQQIYKSQYGMLRTEWRVLFHLGRYGDMTAQQICKSAKLHKTKVSRAVVALEQTRFLTRTRQEHDKRYETLSLTKPGESAYDNLKNQAEEYHKRLTADFTEDETTFLINSLKRLMED